MNMRYLITLFISSSVAIPAQSANRCVEAGVTWKDLSVYLDKEGLSAMTEQSSNIFSIGGSVATNIHGRDIHGPLINSITEITFIDAHGVEQTVNRNNNLAVFRATVGGYGGLGVITKVTLKVENNYLYQAHAVKDVSVAEYVQYLKDLETKPNSLMHYGRVNLSGSKAFTKMSYVEWSPISKDSEPASWSGWKLDLVEKRRWTSSMVMNLMRMKSTSFFGKYLKDFLDNFFGLPKEGTRKTKNNILNNPVQFLFDNFYNRKSSVDILQEYFIPLDKLESFLKDLQSTRDRNKLDLMNVTMRYVPKIERQNDGLLSPYSDKENVVAVVLYFNVQESRFAQNGDLVNYNGASWTQELIQSAQNLGGTFYWPYHRWWRTDQVTRDQEQNIREYYQVKDQVDPLNVFESDFIFYLRRSGSF